MKKSHLLGPSRALKRVLSEERARSPGGLIVAQSHIKVQDLFIKETKNIFSKSDFQISDEQAAAGSSHWSRPSCSGRRFVKVKSIFLIF